MLMAGPLALGCRSPAIADCQDCGEAEGGGGGEQEMERAGAGGGDERAGAGGAGGESPNAPTCTEDADCDDGSYCNGVERCIASGCVAGEAVECGAGTTCDQRAVGSGCFLPRQRWAVWEGNDGEAANNDVSATALNGSTNALPFVLSRGATTEEFTRAWDPQWSPDGRRFTFIAVDWQLPVDRYVYKFFWFDVDAPVEGQPRPLPDIPVTDVDRYVTDWSVDGSVLVIGKRPSVYDPGESHFAVRFDGTDAKSAALPTAAPIQICADDRTMAYDADDGVRLRTIWRDKPVERTVPGKLIGRSPDAKWLLVSDEAAAYLVPCGLEGEPERLGGPAAVLSGWSSDSAYVAYADRPSDLGAEPLAKNVSVFRVEHATKHAARWEGVVADPRVLFEPAGSRFIYVELTKDDEVVWHAHQLASGANTVLPISAGVGDADQGDYVSNVRWLGATGRISDGYVTLNPSEPFDVREFAGTISEDGRYAIWVEPVESDGAHAQVYSLDLLDDAAKPHALLPEPLAGSLDLPEEGRGYLLLRSVSDPVSHMDLYVLPDYTGQAVKVNQGDYVDDVDFAIQPVR